MRDEESRTTSDLVVEAKLTHAGGSVEIAETSPGFTSLADEATLGPS